MAGELKTIYRALNAEEGGLRLDQFAASALGKKYPQIAASWRRNWTEVIPFYDWPLEIRKLVYTTNAIESLNMQVRKVIKNRGHFPHAAAAAKLIYLALRNIVKQWKRPPTHWGAAALQFALKFGERFTSRPWRRRNGRKMKPTQTQTFGYLPFGYLQTNWVGPSCRAASGMSDAVRNGGRAAAHPYRGAARRNSDS